MLSLVRHFTAENSRYISRPDGSVHRSNLIRRRGTILVFKVGPGRVGARSGCVRPGLALIGELRHEADVSAQLSKH